VCSVEQALTYTGVLESMRLGPSMSPRGAKPCVVGQDLFPVSDGPNKWARSWCASRSYQTLKLPPH